MPLIVRFGIASRMERQGLLEEELTRSVIGAFFEVYNTLGFGFLEQIYVLAMERELTSRGHKVDREVPIPVIYKGEQLGTQRLDMVVDGKLVVETKSAAHLPPLAARQLRNYLQGCNLQIGLLLHFGPEPKFYRHVANIPKNDDRDLQIDTDKSNPLRTITGNSRSAG